MSAANIAESMVGSVKNAESKGALAYTPKKHVCYCNESFNSFKELAAHVSCCPQAPQEAREHYLDIMNGKTQFGPELERLRNGVKVHRDSKDHYECHNCATGFSDREDAMTHECQQIEKPKNESKSFETVCRHCKCKFMQSNDQASRDDWGTCPACVFVFKFRKSLGKSAASFPPRDSEGRFVCPSCNFQFVDIQSAREHFKNEHGIGLVETPSIDSTLKDRNSTHGDFEAGSALCEKIVESFATGLNWKSILPHQRHSLHQIAFKISRVLNGNPNHSDHWHDIAGYATLVEKSIKRNQE